MLWDVRTQKSARSWAHAPDAPVEDVVIFPSGTMAASCGGTKVRVWDLLSGRMMASMENHQKTVTTLRHVTIFDDGDPSQSSDEEDEGDGGEKRGSKKMAARSWRSGPRLLTGSVDGHIKVYELDTFSLAHATKYPNPILSFDCAPGGAQLAVGMANGALAVRTRPRKRRPAGSQLAAGGGRSAGSGGVGGRRQRWQSMLTASSYRYFLRGQNYKLTEDQQKDTSIAVAPKPKKGEFLVFSLSLSLSLSLCPRLHSQLTLCLCLSLMCARARCDALNHTVNLKPFDKSLKKFKYREALDQSLQTRDPGVVLAVLERLCAHGGDGHALEAALSQRNASALQPIMKCLCKYVADPRTMKVSVSIAHAGE